MMHPHPLMGMALVLLTLGGLLGALTLYRRWGKPHPELLRKTLHVGMGLVALSFPWLFEEVWPAVLLASFSIILLMSLRLVPTLKSTVGQVVGGVKRFSLGEIYFPLAVMILWILYVHGPTGPPGRQLLLYLIPLLLLTVSDALAAVVGVNYGKVLYATSEGRKSHEGSLAFFLSAFLCCHIPLLLLSDRGRLETLLIAVLLAFLATMFEAIAWAGLDNLVLPLVAYLLLVIYWDEPSSALLARLGVTAGVMAIVILFVWRTTLIGAALPGAFLVGYICWALRGWAWIVPPVLLFVSYPFLSPTTERNSKRVHNIHAVVSVSSASMIWLFLSRLLDRPEWFFPFTVAFAAQLAMIGLARLRRAYPALATPLLLLICIAQGWLMMMAAYVLLEQGSLGAFIQSALALVAVAASACGFYVTQPKMDDCPTDALRWLRQGAWGGVSSGLAAAASFVILP